MKNLKRSIQIGQALVFSLCAMAAQGQVSGDGDQNTENKINSESVDEITVSGHRFPTQRENVAGSVSIISAEDIKSIQASNIADILANQPGIDVESDSRHGIRSINVRGLSGNYVKIKIDNVDQPSGFDNGNLISSSRIDVDIDMIKRIEVIKGPASSTQGSDAIGGSVLFTTIDPVDVLATWGNETNGWFKTDYHSLDNGQSYSMAIANRSDRLESMLAYTYRVSNEAESFGKVSAQSIKQNNVLGKLIYPLTDSQSVKFTAELSQKKSDGAPNAPGRYDDFHFTEDLSQRMRVSLAHQWKADNFLFDRSSLQLDWQTKKQENDTFRKALTADAQLKEYSYNEDSVQLELQLTKNFSSSESGIQQNIAYGFNLKQVEYQNINITWFDDNGDGAINDRSRQYFYMPSANTATSGAYIQNEIILADGRLRVTPGIRYDTFSVDPQSLALDLGDELTGYSSSNSYTEYRDSEVTGRLGLVFAINDSMRIFSQYSQGFKAPDFRQLYYSWSNDLHGYKSEPNPDLKSENSDAIELGLRSNSQGLDWEVAAFSSNYKDFIDSVSDFSNPSFPNGVTRSENIDKAKIKGVEFSSRLSLAKLGGPESMSARLAMSYADGKDGSGDPLESVNPWSANLNLSYEAPSYLWGASLIFNYAASVEGKDVNEPGTQYLPENYTTIDANFFWNPTHALSLRAGVNNLTNNQYERWSNVRGISDVDFNDQYSQSGRSWAVTAKYQL